MDIDIVPDTKDWTWVLERRCPDCGLDASSVQARDVAVMLRTSVLQWEGHLRRDDVRHRPAPSTWSTLEYACHVRDVCRKFAARLTLMLEQDNPAFDNWDQDATATQDRYGEQDPVIVSAELSEAAHALAAGFHSVVGHDWERLGLRSDGAQFSVDSFARYFIHDVVHHLHDVAPGTQTAIQSG